MMIPIVMVLIIVCRTLSSQTAPIVITNNGPVVGSTEQFDNQIINIYRGIPYAKPPIGDLRFKKPQPADNWTEDHIAINYRESCMQTRLCKPFTDNYSWRSETKTVNNPFSGIHFADFLLDSLGLLWPVHVEPTQTSEDCLYLNVFTPTLNTSANLSVMFWIHGGGFSCGSGSKDDGSRLALRNVVVVTINYRLGVFGFLYGNSSEAPGNSGLWDQVMALNWTVRNIANFGGNPNDITVFGQSAGSISISDLIVSNPQIGANKWFSKAIMLSGSAYNIVWTQSRSYAYSLARKYAKKAILSTVGVCKDDYTWIKCLREKNASDLLNAQTKIWTYVKNGALPMVIQFGPIFGDQLIPLSPNAAVKQGLFRHDLRLLISHTEMEGLYFAQLYDAFTQLNITVNLLAGRYNPSLSRPYFITKRCVRNDISKIFFAKLPYREKVAEDYTKVFSKLGVIWNPNPIRRSAVAALSDGYFTCPTILFGAYIAKWQSFTGKVFQSRYTNVGSKSRANGSVWANVTHASDIPFIFGQPLSEESGWSDEDRNMSNKMMDYFTHFAKNGDMSTINALFGVWPSYSVSGDTVNASYVELNADTKRLGRVFTNRYRGSDGYTPRVIEDCFNYWDKLLNSQFN